MALSFSALRSRKSKRRSPPALEQRHADAGLSSTSETDAWNEWTDSLSSPELKAHSADAVPQVNRKERQETSQASITITINLPWQKRSRRTASLPPDNRVRAPLPPPKDPNMEFRVSQDLPRPGVNSPERDGASQFSPRLQQTYQTSPRPDGALKRAPSSAYSGTPALSILSPLTESFDDPKTPTSTTSEIMTSFENSPSSPSQPTYFDEGVEIIHRNLPPSSKPIHDHGFRIRKQTRSRDTTSADAEAKLAYPASVSTTEKVRNPARDGHSLLPEGLARRARSVEPGMHRRRHFPDDTLHVHARGHRRCSSSSDPDSGDDCSAEANHPNWSPSGSSPKPNVSKSSPPARSSSTQGTYGDIIKDYSRIRRAIESETQSQPSRSLATKITTPLLGVTKSPSLSASKPLRSSSITGRSSQTSSAGSGYSIPTPDYRHHTPVEKPVLGPQVLVPDSEDLWG